MSLIHLLLVTGVLFSAPRETVDRLYLGKLTGISHYSIYLPTEDGGFAVVRCGEFTLAKYSRDCRQEWLRELTKGSPPTCCYHISQTQDNGYILAGYQYSLAGPLYYQDGFILRTDCMGKKLWSGTFGGEMADEFRAAVQTEDGGFALFGFTHSFGAVGYDYYLLRVDSVGNRIWERRYWSITDSGAVGDLVGGEIDRSEWTIDEHNYGIGLLSEGDGGFTLIGNVERRINLLKVDEQGRVVSSKLSEDLTINGAFRSSDGGTVVYGSGGFREDPTPRKLGAGLPRYHEILQILQPSHDPAIPPSHDAAGIVKFDSTGIVEWSLRWPGQFRNAFEYRSCADEQFVMLNIWDHCASLVAVGLHDGLITTEYEVMMLHKEKSIPYITPSLDGRLLQFEIRCDQHYDSSDVTISYYNGDVTQSGMRNQGAPLLKASPDLIHVPSDSAIAQIEERYRIPNPFGAINLPYAFTSSIAYLLRRRTTVCMTLCNNGEVLDTLAAGCREAGAWSFVWQPNEKDQFGSFQIRFEDGEGNKDSCRVEVR